MCGLFGYFLTSTAPPYSGDVSSTCNSLSHRGPDDHGIFFDHHHRVCLAHTRLAIQDLSQAGHQPMIASQNNVVLVYNGEIYNSEEIKKALLNSGYSFRGNSDTELLLAYYCYLRDVTTPDTAIASLTQVLRRLNGIYSFAIWDRDLKSIFLVRDPFGVKPLYYYTNSDGIFFSSEVKAFDSIKSDVNYHCLRSYLTYCYSPGPDTPLTSLRKVEPGQLICLQYGLVVSVHKWFKIPSSYSPKVRKTLSSRSYITQTSSFLRQAVHRQLISDVPVGAFLSGGLDSSSIVAFARERSPDIRCFTINVPDSDIDGSTGDLPYARRVAKYLDVPLDVVEVDSSLMARQLEHMVWHLDEPLADPAALNVLFISQLARQQGLKVLLSGSGGDDLFTGYRRHQAVRSEFLWSWLPRQFRMQLFNLFSIFSVDNPAARRFRKLFSGAHLDGDQRILNYFRWISPSDLMPLFSAEFRQALSDRPCQDPMLSFLSNLPHDMSTIDRMLALEQNFFLPDHNLIYTDKMSMAAGVEVRVPFLDIDLVNWASSIPDRFKQRGFQGKWVLKKAMEPYLPHDIIYRPKTGFGAPLRSWLRFELHDWLTDTLSPLRIQQRGFFSSDAVQSLITSNQDGTIDASYTLLSLALIEIWCQHFIDGASPSCAHSI